MIANYDEQIEKHCHPENFEPVGDCETCEFESCDNCVFYRRQVKGKVKKIICPACGVLNYYNAKTQTISCQECGGLLKL